MFKTLLRYPLSIFISIRRKQQKRDKLSCQQIRNNSWHKISGNYHNFVFANCAPAHSPHPPEQETWLTQHPVESTLKRFYGAKYCHRFAFFCPGIPDDFIPWGAFVRVAVLHCSNKTKLMFARKCCELVNLVHILNLVNIKQLSRSSFCLFYGLHKQTWTQRRVQICKRCLTLQFMKERSFSKI